MRSRPPLASSPPACSPTTRKPCSRPAPACCPCRNAIGFHSTSRSRCCGLFRSSPLPALVPAASHPSQPPTHLENHPLGAAGPTPLPPPQLSRRPARARVAPPVHVSQCRRRPSRDQNGDSDRNGIRERRHGRLQHRVCPPLTPPPPRNQPHPSVQTHLRAISHTYGRTNKNTQTAGAGAGAAAVAHTCHEKGARPQNRTPGRRPRLRKINGSGWVDDCRSEPIRVTCIRVLLSRVQCLRPCLTYTNKHTPV